MKSKSYILMLLVLAVVLLAVAVIAQEIQDQRGIIIRETSTPANTYTIPPTNTPTNTMPPTNTISPTNTPSPTNTITPTPSVGEIDLSLLEGLDTTTQGWWYGYKENGKMVYEIPAVKRNQAEKYDGIYKKNDDKKVVYLTFDEGYENGYTPAILDTLKEKNVRAIFFVTGDYLRSSPELVKRMVEEGHLVGNHTNKHPKAMPKISVEQFIDELNATERLYEEVVGEGNRMYYYRPPEGSYSERDLCIAQQMGYKTTFWSFAYNDYDVDAQKGYDFAYNLITSSLHDGEVFLLHAISKDNAAVLGDVIDYIRQEGYDILRIDE